MPRQPAHWAFFFAILAVGGFLRFSGLTWNLERHSAIATKNAPTFHVDESDFANGLRDDFRLFNEKSIVMDGLLVSNLAYWGARWAGVEPGPQWDAALPLRCGRAASALADALGLLAPVRLDTHFSRWGFFRPGAPSPSSLAHADKADCEKHSLSWR